jgi:hypothetical protein
MEGTHLAAWTRRCLGMFTGASLLFATATGSRRAGAKGNGGKTCRKKVGQTCIKQRQPCRVYWEKTCGFDPECAASYDSCCEALAGCKAAQYYECIAPKSRA